MNESLPIFLAQKHGYNPTFIDGSGIIVQAFKPGRLENIYLLEFALLKDWYLKTNWMFIQVQPIDSLTGWCVRVDASSTQAFETIYKTNTEFNTEREALVHGLVEASKQLPE